MATIGLDKLVYAPITEDENGALKTIDFKNEDKFNFAFDVIDAIADKDPSKVAMVHLDNEANERKLNYITIQITHGGICLGALFVL